MSTRDRLCGQFIAASGTRPRTYWETPSSPRVRGRFGPGEPQPFAKRCIPAVRGGSRRFAPSSATRTVHPRVCGAGVARRCGLHDLPGSSPRVRGGLRPAGAGNRHNRCIPACAGRVSGRGPGAGGSAVHPRVCGAGRVITSVGAGSCGASPRVRGGYFVTCGSTARQPSFHSL